MYYILLRTARVCDTGATPYFLSPLSSQWEKLHSGWAWPRRQGFIILLLTVKISVFHQEKQPIRLSHHPPTSCKFHRLSSQQGCILLPPSTIHRAGGLPQVNWSPNVLHPSSFMGYEPLKRERDQGDQKPLSLPGRTVVFHISLKL